MLRISRSVSMVQKLSQQLSRSAVMSSSFVTLRAAASCSQTVQQSSRLQYRPQQQQKQQRSTQSSLTVTSFPKLSVRSFGGDSSFLERKVVEERVLDLVKRFPKVSGHVEKVNVKSHFVKDLGLDSLDEVELIMAVEDEFGIEIPDAEADKLHTIEEAIAYVAATPFAK